MRIEVAGIPAPQGSKRHVGGGRMVEVSRAVGPWREAVRAETQRAVETEMLTHGDKWALTGPVTVQAVFYLPRPVSAPKSVMYPAKRPDLDKLVRAVLDGITAGGAIIDDAQVVTIFGHKRFATLRPAGCVIKIESV